MCSPLQWPQLCMIVPAAPLTSLNLPLVQKFSTSRKLKWQQPPVLQLKLKTTQQQLMIASVADCSVSEPAGGPQQQPYARLLILKLLGGRGGGLHWPLALLLGPEPRLRAGGWGRPWPGWVHKHNYNQIYSEPQLKVTLPNLISRHWNFLIGTDLIQATKKNARSNLSSNPKAHDKLETGLPPFFYFD